MSTAPTAIVEELFKSKNTLNTCITPGFSSALAELRATGDRILSIANALQTTLEVEEVLSLFMRETSDLMEYDSLSYSNPSQGIEFMLGRKSLHSCSYSLDLLQQSLGEISFSRRRRFSEEEMQLIEQLLCVLVYPLRNALMYQQAVRAATKDALTGLYNRAALDDALAREIKLANRYHSPLSLIVLDIDHFKRINDGYGHACGDVAIKSIADAIRSTARTSDLLFRYGGEEFVMALPNTDLVGASLLADRLREYVQDQVCTCPDGRTIAMTISLGVTQTHADDDGHSLFLRADNALYRSKQGGRNRVTTLA